MTMPRVGAKAVLEGVGEFTRGVSSMDAAIEGHARKTEASSRTAGVAYKAFAATVIAAGAAITAGLGAAAVAGANFEKTMSGVKAVSGATAAEMKQLSGLALQLGKDTSFSASEAAAGIEELVKGGITVAEIMDGAAVATLNLAAAGGVDLASAAEIAANAINTFNLSGSDMTNVANKIAGAANASSIGVNDFKFSLAASGAVAAVTGLSFDDLAVSIALLGAAGIKGQDAGTSLKTLLVELQPVTDKDAKAFKELGLITADGANKFFDASGKIRSMSEVAEVLHNSLGGLTEQSQVLALKTLFGTDAMRAAAILTREGAKGFDTMAGSMSKVTAEMVALERLNNLSGDLEQLTGSLETVATRGFLQASAGARDFLQNMKLIVDNSEGFAEAVGSNVGSVLATAGQAAVIASYGLAQFAGAMAEMNRTMVAPAQRSGDYSELEGNFLQGEARAQADLMDAVRKANSAFIDNEYVITVAANAAAKLTTKIDAAAVATRAWIPALSGSGGGGSGSGGGGVTAAVEKAKTAFELYGVSMDFVRRAGEDLNWSQEQVDATILAFGGTLLDTGPIVEGFGQTTVRLAAALNAVGVDGEAAVASLIAVGVAAKVAQEAKVAEAEAERAAEKARQDAIEAERLRLENLKKAREAVLAGITGSAAANILGGVRSRGAAPTAGGAADDFAQAAAGLDKLTTAGLDTGVAIQVMEARLAQLSGRFAMLNGDDLASAGVATDRARALIAAFQDGSISIDEFNAGIGDTNSELGRLAGVVDDADAAAEKLREDWRKLWEGVSAAGFDMASAVETAASATQLWQFQLENGLGPAWTQIGVTAATALKKINEDLDLARAQMADLLRVQGIEDAHNQSMTDMRRLDIAAAAGTLAFEAAQANAIAAGLGMGEQTFFSRDHILEFLRGIAAMSAAARELLGEGVSEFAGGVHNFRGGMAVVGERGPELVQLPMGASVTPMNRTTNYNLTANYTRQEEPQSIRYELETLALLSGR